MLARREDLLNHAPYSHPLNWSYHLAEIHVLEPLSAHRSTLGRPLPSFCFQSLPTVNFLNSFVLTFIHQCRGCTPLGHTIQGWSRFGTRPSLLSISIHLVVFFWSRVGPGEGAEEEDELPALILSDAFLESRHGSAAFGDLVKHLAVCDCGHACGVCEVSRSRAVHPGFRAVAFAGLAMALRALLGVDLARRAQVGVGGDKRVFKILEFPRNNPGFALLCGPIEDQDADGGKKSGEENLAQLEMRWPFDRHVRGKNSRTSSCGTKGQAISWIQTEILRPMAARLGEVGCV